MWIIGFIQYSVKFQAQPSFDGLTFQWDYFDGLTNPWSFVKPLQSGFGWSFISNVGKKPLRLRGCFEQFSLKG
jgi:hypothetical protein